MCVHTMALVFNQNPEFPVDPRFSSFGLKRKRKRGRPKNIGGALDRRVPRAADQGEADQGEEIEEIEEGELLRGEVGPNIAPMEEEIGGEEGGDEEEGWVMGPNILPMERGGEERGGEDEEVGTDEVEEEAEPPGQHTRFGPRWANFVRNLIE